MLRYICQNVHHKLSKILKITPNFMICTFWDRFKIILSDILIYNRTWDLNFYPRMFTLQSNKCNPLCLSHRAYNIYWIIYSNLIEIFHFVKSTERQDEYQLFYCMCFTTGVNGEKEKSVQSKTTKQSEAKKKIMKKVIRSMNWIFEKCMRRLMWHSH